MSIAGTRVYLWHSGDVSITLILFYHPSQMHISDRKLWCWWSIASSKEYDLVPPHPSVELEAFSCEKMKWSESNAENGDYFTTKLASGIKEWCHWGRGKILLNWYWNYCFRWCLIGLMAQFSLCRAGKIDNSLTQKWGWGIISFRYSDEWIAQEPVLISHQFRSAIKQFEKDQMWIRNIWIRLKAKMFGDFLQSLIQLEIWSPSVWTSAHQTVTLLMIFQRFYKGINLQDIIVRAISSSTRLR